MFKRILAIVFAVGLFTSACEKEFIPAPDFLISEDMYLSLMIELQLLDALVYESDSLSNTDSLKHEIFNKYSTSQAQFFESHTYYQSKVEEHKVRLDTVLSIINKQRLLLEIVQDSSNVIN